MNDGHDVPDSEHAVARLTRKGNRPSVSTMYADAHWVSTDDVLERILNDDYGPNNPFHTWLPYNIVQAHGARDQFGGELETLVEIPPIPPGCVP